MTAVTYKCAKCGKEFKLMIQELPIPFTVDCIKNDCDGKAKRVWGNVGVSKEDPNVSGAIQMMLYSKD